jgi:hypothetical protein
MIGMIKCATFEGHLRSVIDFRATIDYFNDFKDD